MKAIETRYHGPGNVRGARISASDMDGNRVFVPYDHGSDTENAHALAAVALCAKMGWNGELISGATRRGYVFVFLDNWTKHYSLSGFLPKEIRE